jgi:GC-rich sequence DNA-binding factor
MPDKEMIRLAKAKRERLRQAHLAPDYLPLGGASRLLGASGSAAAAGSSLSRLAGRGLGSSAAAGGGGLGSGDDDEGGGLGSGSDR